MSSYFGRIRDLGRYYILCRDIDQTSYTGKVLKPVVLHIYKHQEFYKYLSYALLGIGALATIGGVLVFAPHIYTYMALSKCLLNTMLGTVTKAVIAVAAYLFDVAIAMCAWSEASLSQFSILTDGGFLRKVAVLTSLVPAGAGIVLSTTMTFTHMCACLTIILSPIIPGVVMLVAGKQINDLLKKM